MILGDGVVYTFSRGVKLYVLRPFRIFMSKICYHIFIYSQNPPEDYMSKVRDFFAKVSTRPSVDSTKWLGKHRSILTTIFLWLLYFCRILSFLQWVKIIYRGIASGLQRSTKDKNSTRVNVPACLPELYYIVWFIFVLCCYLFNFSNTVTLVFNLYFIFESFVWILYYSIFRRFFEEHYAIVHPLEYCILLMLIIPTQAMSFTMLYSGQFGNYLTAIMGNNNVGNSLVEMFGVIYGALVIGIIISNLPNERVKSENIKNDYFIIGNGDVVKNRLYPALSKSIRENERITIYDIAPAGTGNDKKINLFKNSEDLLRSLKQHVSLKSVVWVACPTSYHVDYLEELIKGKTQLIVMEKPICNTKADLDRVKVLLTDNEKRNRIFFQSYYVLEKALPLYMIADYNEIYAKYLDIENRAIITDALMKLGAVVSVNVSIVEKEDARDWTFKNGGQIFETFIHNVLIAALFVGRPSGWSNVDLSENTTGNMCDISLKADYNGASINLLLKKGATEVSRGAEILFENGKITADFSTESATVSFYNIRRSLTVSVKDGYIKQRYSILSDLIMRVTEGELKCYEADGLKNQLEIIEWLISMQSEKRISGEESTPKHQ